MGNYTLYDILSGNGPVDDVESEDFLMRNPKVWKSVSWTRRVRALNPDGSVSSVGTYDYLGSIDVNKKERISVGGENDESLLITDASYNLFLEICANESVSILNLHEYLHGRYGNSIADEGFIEGIDYGGTTKYAGQFPLIEKADADGNLWMYNDPCSCPKNKQRITDVIRAIILDGRMANKKE